MNRGSFLGCGFASIVGLGLFAGIGALFVSGIFALTRPVVDASEQFLALLGQGKIAEAYSTAAAGLRTQQDEASFAAAVKQLGLSNYSSVSWHNRQIENREGTAEGTVITKSGSVKPISIRLVRDEGKWAVVGVRYGGVELASIKAPPSTPPASQLERMVADALLSFNQAVQAKDFTNFYGTLSDLWKKQTTPQELQKIFQEFVDKQIDIGPIKDLRPVLARPAVVNDKGTLVVAGHYATQPSQVHFELEYAQERGGWKLSGILVKVTKGAAAD